MIKSISEERKSGLKNEFKELLFSTKRENIESLWNWLENETDFFDAPASAQFHGDFDGGLAVHSMNVYKLLKNFTKNIGYDREDSLIIAGLLHDVCKANFYTKGKKNVKVLDERTGRYEWVEEEYYATDDSFPMGHGEKSVFLIMRHIQLTDDEAMAIRWHMGGYDDTARSFLGGKAQSAAYRMYPLAPALSIADMYATYFAE